MPQMRGLSTALATRRFETLKNSDAAATTGQGIRTIPLEYDALGLQAVYGY